jgi:hypothetical protein
MVRGGTPRLPKGLRYRSGLRFARPNRFTMATQECFYFWGIPQTPKKYTHKFSMAAAVWWEAWAKR